MYSVKNKPLNWKNHKYTVIRDCRNEEGPAKGFWYYGGYDSLQLAQEAKNELGNGWIVETSDINDYE